jgi:hypothetical protein
MSFEQDFCQILQITQDMDVFSRMVEKKTVEGILILIRMKSYGPSISLYFGSNPDEYVGFISETIKVYREEVDKFRLSIYYLEDRMWETKCFLPAGFWWNPDPLSRSINYGMATFHLRQMKWASDCVYHTEEEMSDITLSAYVEKLERRFDTSLSIGYYTGDDMYFVKNDERRLSTLLSKNKNILIASFASIETLA